MQKDELGWTSKIVVAEKTTPRSSTRSPVKYQSLILVDPEVTLITLERKYIDFVKLSYMSLLSFAPREIRFVRLFSIQP